MVKNNLSILLIHPEISRTKYNFVGVIENECLELEYIATMLGEEGHQVYLYDGQIETMGVPQALKKYKPDFVYICGRTRQENFMLEYCRDAKEFREDIITVIGGLHAQLCYERMYKDYVDYILTTFDIFKLIDIIKYSILQQDIDVSKLEGICYKREGQWFHNNALPFEIKKLPLPDRTYFYEHPSNYRYLALEHAAWVRTAYCCPYRCRFCHRNKMNAGKYVTRDIEDVVKEIESIQSDNIYIVDDDFLIDKDRLSKFVQLIKEKKIRKNYICYGRADFIANNSSIMADLKEIGLYYVLVGLEAIYDQTLVEYNKHSNLQNNVETISTCNQLGINIMGMFIVNFSFTPKDFNNLYRWIKKNQLKHVAISIFTPEFTTDVYDEFKDRMITDNPSHWDYLHLVATPVNISVKRYYFCYYKLLIKLFIRAKRQGVYDFIDYGYYIKSFIKNVIKSKRSNDDL